MLGSDNVRPVPGIFVFSEKRIGGVCSRARCLRARKVLRQQLRHGVCCAHSPAFACSCSAHGWSGSAIGIKFRSEGPCNEQGRCPSALARWPAVFWGRVRGGGSLRAPTQRSERSTRLPQAQRLLTTYKRLVPNPNTATPLLVFHGAHIRGLGASGAAMVRFEQPLAPPWRRSSIWPRDMAVEWL